MHGVAYLELALAVGLLSLKAANCCGLYVDQKAGYRDSLVPLVADVDTS